MRLLLALALAAWCARWAVTGAPLYTFIAWNVLLAWLPLPLLTLAERVGARPAWRPLVLAAAALLFLPNAPYLVTDLKHP